ncbi:unnamed protein product [Protopolystoma xenopodis]|uniref:Uncharacterized protein n=1 Tax=Protopolystoma xenopodis TaxID=117903 RepID=A0A448WRC8_9PLAT|nr:unnamed protein product [Protopolystoma xenopodis]
MLPQPRGNRRPRPDLPVRGRKGNVGHDRLAAGMAHFRGQLHPHWRKHQLSHNRPQLYDGLKGVCQGSRHPGIMSSRGQSWASHSN